MCSQVYFILSCFFNGCQIVIPFWQYSSVRAQLNHADILCNYMLMISGGRIWLFVLAWSCLQTENCHRGSVVFFSQGEALFDMLSEGGAGSESKYFFCLLFSMHKNRGRELCFSVLYWWYCEIWRRRIWRAVLYSAFKQARNKSLTIWLLWMRVWPV